MPKKKIDAPEKSGAWRALDSFLDSWFRRDWKTMKAFCQITWRSRETSPLDWLRDYYSPRELFTFKIMAEEKISETVRIVYAEISFAAAGNVYKGFIAVKVSRESAAFCPDPNGVWGVNPISAYDVKKGVKWQRHAMN